MTVAELLAAILKAYSGADADAIATFKPAFYARFERREGPHLAAAFNETLATFKPTARQPFPIAADIEQHMPSLPKTDGNAGAPIRDKLEQIERRAHVLLADWVAGQGAKIKASRHPDLYAACWREAKDTARQKALDNRITGIVLDQAMLNRCFQHALSLARRNRHGPPPKDPQMWWLQLVDIAREWNLEITPSWWSEETGKTMERREAA